MEKDNVENSVNNVITQMQNRIGELECWQDILKCKSFVTQARKERYSKMGVYSKVEQELYEFCTERIQSIVSLGELKEKNKTNLNSHNFTEDEFRVLKKIAEKMIVQEEKTLSTPIWDPNTKREIKPVNINNDGFDMDADTNSMEPGQRLVYLKEKKRRQRLMRQSEERLDTVEESNTSVGPVVGSTQVLAGTSSLKFEGGKVNSPPPFSQVKILDVKDGVARIAFTDPGYSGSNATIKINELVGYEYLEAWRIYGKY